MRAVLGQKLMGQGLVWLEEASPHPTPVRLWGIGDSVNQARCRRCLQAVIWSEVRGLGKGLCQWLRLIWMRAPRPWPTDVTLNAR